MIFRMDPEQELTPDKLGEFISKAKKATGIRFSPLRDAYRGRYAIFRKKKKPNNKPDNRLAVNFAKYITDTFNGFFIGNAVKTTSDDENVGAVLEAVEAYNDQDDNNAELSKLTSIYGRAYEMYFVDEDRQIGITYLSPMDSFMIYGDGILETPLYFVHWYVDADNVEQGSVSDNTYVRYFERKDGRYVWLGEPIVHGFDGVPATEFIENDERMGIFESVMSLIDAYNKALSEKANDVDYFADAYLKVLGSKLEHSDLKDLRDQRIINLAGEMDQNLVVEFMEKPSADTTQQNLLNALERLIYQISMVPNINDENFGTSSGIAMQYKLLNTSNLFKAKQRKFESGMNRRWKIIFSNPLVQAPADSWTKIRYRFTPNIPANALEEAQTAAQVSGITSRRTQLELLSFVDNVDQEIDRIEKEESETPLLDFDAHTDHEVVDDVVI